MALLIENLTVEALEKLIEASVEKALSNREFKKQDPPEEYLTRKEACKILKISGPTLSAYTKEGTIPYHKVGSRIRYKKSEIHNLENPVFGPKKLKK